MKRIVFGLFVVTLLALSAAPAEAYGHGPRPPGGYGYYAGYGSRYAPWGPGYYPAPRPYYRPAPVPVVVAPVAPVYPYPAYPAPRQGFSYFSPGFSFSFGR
jgi:hypothetical protein